MGLCEEVFCPFPVQNSTMAKSIGVFVLLAAALFGCANATFDEVVPEETNLVEVLPDDDLPRDLKSEEQAIGQEAKEPRIKPSQVEHPKTDTAEENQLKPASDTKVIEPKTKKPIKCAPYDTLCRNLMALKVFLFAGNFKDEFTVGQIGVLEKLIEDEEPTEDPVLTGKHEDASPEVAQEEYQKFQGDLTKACETGDAAHGIYCKMGDQITLSLKSKPGLLDRSEPHHVCLNTKAVGLAGPQALGHGLCVTLSSFLHEFHTISHEEQTLPTGHVVSVKTLKKWGKFFANDWKGDM